MRVIAGKYRRRSLHAPAGLNTRPILDRVKTSLFDWLGSRLAMPGELPALPVLDLYCGGGSLGIEALSRGASSCAFVERDPEALRCLHRNLDELQIGPVGRIYPGAAATVRIGDPGHEGFATIFMDPPYRLSEDCTNGSEIVRVVSRFGHDVHVSPAALIVWRHDAKVVIPQAISSWRQIDQRTWGGMSVTLFSRQSDPAP